MIKITNEKKIIDGVRWVLWYVKMPTLRIQREHVERCFAVNALTSPGISKLFGGAEAAGSYVAALYSERTREFVRLRSCGGE